MVQISADVTDPRVRAMRRKILLAASEVFREKGLHAAGMRDIAGRAGMTVGNLYYYFKNKNDLLAFCQADALERLLELARRVGEEEAEPHRRLFRLLAGHVKCLNEDVPASLAHIDEAGAKGVVGRRIAARRDDYEARVVEIIRSGQRRGVFRKTDPKVAAKAVLGAVNWTVRWFSPGGRRSAEEIGTEFADQLVRGLLAPGVELDPAPSRPKKRSKKESR